MRVVEGRGQGERGRALGQAHALVEVGEVATRPQGGRGEEAAADGGVEAALELARHLHRRGRHAQVALAPLVPAGEGVGIVCGLTLLGKVARLRFVVPNPAQALGQFPGADAVLLPDRAVALADLFQLVRARLQQIDQMPGKLGRAVLSGKLRGLPVQGIAAPLRGKGGGEAVGGGGKLGGQGPRRLPGLAGKPGLGLALQVGRQIEALQPGKATTEKGGGHVFQMVGLVEERGLVAGQNLAVAAPAHGQIREEQVVVHHHEVGGGRVPAQLREEAGRCLGAVLAQTEMVLAANRLPERRGPGQPFEFGPVAVPGFFQPDPDLLRRRVGKKPVLPRGEHLLPAV